MQFSAVSTMILVTSEYAIVLRFVHIVLPCVLHVILGGKSHQDCSFFGILNAPILSLYVGNDR